MKKYLTSLLILIFAASVGAQSTPVKIVFDVTSKDEATHQSVMRHVKMMSAAYPESSFEVVVYGGALPMVLKDQSSVKEDLVFLEKSKNVSLKVCEGTMKRHGADISQVIPGVDPVADGIFEIVTRQAEGWAYIKEAHH